MTRLRAGSGVALSVALGCLAGTAQAQPDVSIASVRALPSGHRFEAASDHSLSSGKRGVRIQVVVRNVGPTVARRVRVRLQVLQKRGRGVELRRVIRSIPVGKRRAVKFWGTRRLEREAPSKLIVRVEPLPEEFVQRNNRVSYFFVLLGSSG